MRIGMLSPIAWRTPPRHYGPWESVVSLLTEGLVSRGHDVTHYTGTSEIYDCLFGRIGGSVQNICAKTFSGIICL